MLSAISIHSLHTEGDAISSEPIAATISFQSTPSTRRETSATSCTGHGLTHFNPLPPHGGRLGFHCFSPPRCYFNPLPPHGGRRAPSVCSFTWLIFQSTPSTRRETQLEVKVEQDRPISIHSLHTEGDDMQWYLVRIHRHFNPLPPHGGRQYQIMFRYRQLLFQSTPSTRRETKSGTPLDQFIIFQSTPSTRRETFSTYPYCVIVEISIHSLHTEGDNRTFAMNSTNIQFQSTPSTRRETSLIHTIRNKPFISIHSLHTEGDHTDSDDAGNEKAFQSTPSTRRETQEEADRQGITLFQSTPSTRRETCFIAWSGICKFYFNPLPPHGGRLRSMIIPSFQKSISIHSLHTEGDDKVRGFVHKHKAFQSTPSTRRETQGKRFCA